MSELVPMLSWKLWRWAGGHLMSPWQYGGFIPPAVTTLPPDGVIRARCVLVGHDSPHDDCTCGVYSIPDARTMLQYKVTSGATMPLRYALTWGTAEGRIVSGRFGTPFTISMPGLVSSSYRAQAILTENDGRGLMRYGVPIHRGPLTISNMRELERLYANPPTP